MNKIFVIFIAFSLFISSLCIDGCKTKGQNNKCTTCNDGYLLVNDGASCFYGCKTEDSSNARTFKRWNDGYLLVNDGAACIWM